MWDIEPTDEFERRYRYFQKKRPRELAAMLDNLDTYQRALRAGAKIPGIHFGFMHHEPKGIVGIDQKGGGKALKEARLYIYPDATTKTIHGLTIGDKKTQHEDIEYAKKMVDEIRKRFTNDNQTSVQERVGDGPSSE